MQLDLGPAGPATLGVMAATSFVSPFIGSAVNVAIPAIGRQLGGTAADISWVVTGYLLTTAVALLPVGRLGDMFGRGNVFIGGLWSFVALSLACAQANTLEWLIFFRSLQGVAAAMIFATSMAILTTTYPVERRGLVLGINVTAVYLGGSMGPVLGGLLTDWYGWRSIFYFVTLLSILAGLLAKRGVPAATRRRGEGRFDLIGASLNVAMLSALVFGCSRFAADPGAIWLIAAGLGLIACFVAWELKQSHPLLEVRLFTRSRSFALSNLAAMIHYAATFGIGFLLSLRLQLGMGVSEQLTGLILLAQPLAMTALAAYAGSLSDHIAPRLLASAGMAMTALGLLALAFVGAHSSLWLTVAVLFFIGIGFAFFSSPNNNAIMSAVPKAYLGAASATLATMRMTGMSFSMAMSASIISWEIGGGALSQVDPDQLEAGVRLAFLLFAGLCGAGVAASLSRGGKQP